jgi:hypothetical protein
MKRRTRYLAAGILAAAKPFFLGALAVRLGLGDSGGTASQVLRYMIFPQIVPAACFFLVYRDETLLKPLKPLVAIYALGSLFLLAFLLFPILRDPRSLILASGGGPGVVWSLAAIAGALLADLSGAFALVPDRHVTADKES